MNQRKNFFAGYLIALGVALLTLSGCGTSHNIRTGVALIDKGDYETGLKTLERNAAEHPLDGESRLQYLYQKERSVSQLIRTGNDAFVRGDYEASQTAYEKAIRIDPLNDVAKKSLELVAKARVYKNLLKEARAALGRKEFTSALEITGRVLAESPNYQEALALKTEIEDKQASARLAVNLSAYYRKPVTLEFRDADVRAVFEALTRASGLNFVIDQTVASSLHVTVFVRETPLEDAIEYVLNSTRLTKKVLNENTLMIVAAPQAQESTAQEMVTKRFYMSDSNVRQAADLVRNFVKPRDVFVDERTNQLIVRDTRSVIQQVQNLIKLYDIPESEVMLEVEVLEVQSSRLTALGMRYPQQVTMDLFGSHTGDTLTLRDLKSFVPGNVTISPITAGIDLKSELGDVNILANPKIRARNKEKASIKIGDKVPVITTTTSTTTSAQSDSVQYLDVGLNVEVEPDIHPDNELNIKLKMEVSSVVREVRGGNGSLAYQIGTRNVQTVLRLKDSEPQILGGLIRNDETDSSTGLPALSQIPILGRLFSSKQNSKSKTEIVLSITPHLIRTMPRADGAGNEIVGRVIEGSGSNSGQQNMMQPPAYYPPAMGGDLKMR